MELFPNSPYLGETLYPQIFRNIVIPPNLIEDETPD